MKEIQDYLYSIKITDEILYYITDLCEATRRYSMVELGVSPRGVNALAHLVRARAILRERDFVTPEDIKFVAPYVLQHRLILPAEAEMEGYSPVKVTQRLIDKVEVPK